MSQASVDFTFTRGGDTSEYIYIYDVKTLILESIFALQLITCQSIIISL
jgi:hypothetical protein